MKQTIYTDGSCVWSGSGANHPGGWACIHNGSIVSSGKVASTTSNIMELTGILYALRYAFTNKREFSLGLEVISDSQYAVNMSTGFWGLNDKSKNVSLISSVKEAIKMLEDAGVSVSIRWERSDSSSGNMLADKEANRQSYLALECTRFSLKRESELKERRAIASRVQKIPRGGLSVFAKNFCSCGKKKSQNYKQCYLCSKQGRTILRKGESNNA